MEGKEKKGKEQKGGMAAAVESTEKIRGWVRSIFKTLDWAHYGHWRAREISNDLDKKGWGRWLLRFSHIENTRVIKETWEECT